MFVYEKKLQYPVRIKNTNPKLAALIISQYGGPYPNKLRKHLLRRVLSLFVLTTVAFLYTMVIYRKRRSYHGNHRC